MAKKTTYHTDVSKMRFDGRVNQAIWNGEQAVRMIYNKDVVFNRAEYHLYVPDVTELEAVGTKDEPLSNFIGVESYKLDYDGTRSEVIYRGGSDKIAANNTTEPKTGEYTIIQEMSALLISGKWTQAGKKFLHYSFKQIRSVSVDYEEATASGGKVEPYVIVNLWLLEHWSDESTVDKYVSYRGTVSSATGKVISDNAVGSYSTIDKSTGVVTVPSLGTTERAARNVFTVETLAGTVTIPEVDNGKVVAWSWNEGLNVVQNENYKRNHGTPTYSLTSAVSATELNAVDTSIKVTGTAVKTSYYYYDSDPSDIKSTNTNETLYVLLDDNVNDSRQLTGADASTTFDVGVNTSIESARTFKIRVYNTGLGYDKTHSVTQKKNSMTTYWTAAVLNGNVVVENVLADGTGQPVLVPITQKKYGRLEGINTDTYLETYSSSVSATAIGGTPESGTGATFNDGVIKANSLGRTETTSARTIYTLTSVKVTGVDGKSYTLNLPSAVTVKQDKNTRYATSQGYVLSVSADPTSGISNLGGSSTITASAQEKFEITFDADATKTYEYPNASATLETTLGTLSKTSITGTGQTATLSFGLNAREEVHTATVTLAIGGTKTTCTVKQNAAVYVLTAGDNHECGADASTVNVKFTSSRNGEVWEPTFSVNLSGATINKSGITLSGFTYTVPVNIPKNTAYEPRNVVVTATQTRYEYSKTATVTITQAAAAAVVERKVSAVGTWNAAYTAVVGITATLYNKSDSSVTFSGIKVELRRNKKYIPEESELATTPKTYDGEVTVAANSSKAISISNITHTMDKSYYYWLAAYATQTTETVYEEIEQEVQEG